METGLIRKSAETGSSEIHEQRHSGSDSDMNLAEQNLAEQSLAEMSLAGENLLTDGAACSPVLNMALDSWLAEKKPLAESEAVLRIYRWSPAGISIGRNQRWERALNRSGLGDGECAVRRITGGRAIYHDPDELTYSFVMRMPEGEVSMSEYETVKSAEDISVSSHGIVGRERVAVQKEIADLIVQSLLRFLRSSGIDAHAERRVGYVPAHRADRQSPHCFVSAARHEITASGRKIVASAQRIRAGRYFQHGSIKLNGATVHPALFERPDKASRSVGNVVVRNIVENGNNSAADKRYTIDGEGRTSGAIGALSAVEPRALRKAFEATFGRGLSLGFLTQCQREEVFEQLADIDSIVGHATPAVGLSHSPPPHLIKNPHEKSSGRASLGKGRAGSIVSGDRFTHSG